MLLGDADVEDALGERARRTRSSPTGYSIAAVIATRSSRSLAERDQLLGEDVGPDPAARATPAPVSGSNGARLVQLVGLVALGRRVAEALAGDDVHDHRAAEAAGLAQRLLDGAAVVAVDRADVLQAEVLEHALRARARP